MPCGWQACGAYAAKRRSSSSSAAVHAQGALAVVGEIETLAFYARADLLPSDAQALRQAYQTLWQGMKPLRKAYLTLYRAIVPMKMRNFTQS